MSTQELLNTYVLPHWPFFAVSLIFAWVGQVMKGLVTNELASQKRWAWFFRKTMPLHPVLAGIVVGYSNLLPASMGAESPGSKALYFGIAGVFSSYIFEAIRHFAKKKGVDLPTPGGLMSTKLEESSSVTEDVSVHVSDEDTPDDDSNDEDEQDAPNDEGDE